LFDAIAAADADAARQGMTVLVRLAFEDMQPALD
jgi:hypothetical protein